MLFASAAPHSYIFIDSTAINKETEAVIIDNHILLTAPQNDRVKPAHVIGEFTIIRPKMPRTSLVIWTLCPSRWRASGASTAIA